LRYKVKHLPVMVREVLDWLNLKEGHLYVDCTLGGGGHSKAILEKTKGRVRILGIDRDEEALEIAKDQLKAYKNQVIFVRDNFKSLSQILKRHRIEKADGILYDLGMSSLQVDSPERGFSFRYSAPLDMRMDKRQELTAAKIINEAPESELEEIFWRFGEERWAKRIAKFIISQRKTFPITTTQDLVEVAKKAIPSGVRHKGRIHFATRVFQALRIKVNDELKNLDEALRDSFYLLSSSGRICVISYHSLEDRLVKRKFKEAEGKQLKILTKKVIKPSLDEVKINPRARSAKLRVAEKI